MDGAAALRAELEAPGVLVAPGVYDGLSLALTEGQGFRAGHLTGSGGAASFLGLPDIGVVSMGEMVDHVRRLASVARIPLIADGDTGYGGALQVRRTVDLMIGAGAAGAHFEDQETPKRCGFLPGRTVIAPTEFAEKIEAAVHARGDHPFVIIARTDALRVLGPDDAIERARSYRDAGADLLFIEGIADVAQLELIGAEVPGPKMLNMAGDLAQLQLDDATLCALGFKVLIYPGLLIDNAARAIAEALTELGDKGRSFAPRTFLGPVGLSRTMGIEDWLPGLLGADNTGEPR